MQAIRITTEDTGVERRCPKCGEFWPEDTEFFFRDGKRGLDCYCKACRQEIMHRWYHEKVKGANHV